jgi:YVTN family beta-propeller protein
MKLRISELLAIATFALTGILGSAQAFAQNAYITNTNSHGSSVLVIDTANNTVTATIPVGGEPFGVAVSSDGSKVYVTNINGDSVSVIDTATNTGIATIPVGDYPEGVAVTPDGSKVFVANQLDGTVSVIATATNTVTATIPIGTFPFGGFVSPLGVAVSPDGSKVYVTNAFDSVSVIATVWRLPSWVMAGPEMFCSSSSQRRMVRSLRISRWGAVRSPV